MEIAHFSLPVAIVTMMIGLSTNLIKSYSGFGGGILFVSLMKLAGTAGLLMEEGHERGLGGMAGNLALVTVMETFTTCPLAIYERKNVHWPLFMALMVGSILMVPVGTSFLMGTLDDDGGDEYAMLLKKCFGVLIICFVIVQVRCALPSLDNLEHIPLPTAHLYLTPPPHVRISFMVFWMPPQQQSLGLQKLLHQIFSRIRKNHSPALHECSSRPY